ncbi:DUF2125 domain-containing protein [Roseibium sp.]|uniref:DUF2125 domain-containing protein n=1 Tax=Roseibium sp. TaxID=1936156 RepID=UPI003A96E806
MDAGPKRNLKLRYWALAVGVTVVILGWSGGWFYLRAELENQIGTQLERLERRGQTASCANMAIAGFPFRFEVSCSTPQISDTQGRSSEIRALRTVALIYKPWHVIAEAAGPLMHVDRALGLEVRADWQTARSSFIFSTQDLQQFDFSADGVRIAAAGPVDTIELAAGKGELHTRPLPGVPETLEVFLTVDDLRQPQAMNADNPFSLKLHTQVADGMALMGGRGLESLFQGYEDTIPVKLVWASLVSGTMEIDVSGDLEIDRDGYASGRATMTLKGSEGLSRRLLEIFPNAEDAIGLIEGAALSFGERSVDDQGVPQIRLPLTLKNGRISVGLVPLWVLPPLFGSES